MPTVSLKHENERFDSLFRRFKKAVDKDNTLRECQDREYYERPSIKRKRAKAAAIKRWEKQRKEMELPQLKHGRRR